MSICRIELFGGLRVICGEREILRFRTQKAASLLSYLALHPNRAHAREMLAELLWPEVEVDTGRHNLRMALNILRRQLEPPGTLTGSILISDRSSIRLNSQTIQTDVGEFEEALRTAEGTTSATKIHFLAEAVSRFQGELLPANYDEWVEPVRQRLAEKRRSALRALVAGLREAQDLTAASEYTRLLVETDPFEESAQRELMQLHQLAGHPEAALEQFSRFTERLRTEMDCLPASETRQLAEQIRAELQRSKGHGAASTLPNAVSVASAQPRTTHPSTETLLALDRNAQPVPTNWRARVERLVADQDGRLLRAGEGYWLAVFPQATSAFAMAEALRRTCADVSHCFRLALHTADAATFSTTSIGKWKVHDAASPTQVVGNILLAAHPGQVLVSAETATLLQRRLPEGAHLHLLGNFRPGGVARAERLYQVQFPGEERQEFPPLLAPVGQPGRLPVSLTRFVGREKELKELERLVVVEKIRLLTLTGVGGIGKTRLALELALRLDTRFGGAVWFVPLADLTDAVTVPERMLDALKLPRFPGVPPLEQVTKLLEESPTLLVLDNLEHLLPDASTYVEALLRRVPTLTCLATSRRSLDVDGEQELPVSPLPVPEEGLTPEQLVRCESVTLLVDRARSARPDFQVTHHNAAAIGGLCRSIEGLPLALELTASWASVLSPAQMLDQVGQCIDTPRRGVSHESRHSSLRSTLDWSYHLLSPEARQLFIRLSVFRGGWTIEAAKMVCAEPRAIELLLELRQSSVVTSKETADGMRFGMLETLREFAAKKLPPDLLLELQRRHGEFFLALAEMRGAAVLGMARDHFERLEREESNFRVALTTALRIEPILASRLALVLVPFWMAGSRFREATDWLGRATLGEGFPDVMRGRGLGQAGKFAFFAGDLTHAKALLEEAIVLLRAAGEERLVSEPAAMLSLTLMNLGEFTSAEALAEKELANTRACSDQPGQCWLLLALGVIRVGISPTRTDCTLLEESVALARLLHLPELLAMGLPQLLGAWDMVSERKKADELIQELREQFRVSIDRRGEAVLEYSLHHRALRYNNWPLALAHLRIALGALREGHGPWAIAIALDAAAMLLVHLGQEDRATRILSAVQALRAQDNITPLPGGDSSRETCAATARAGLGDEDFHAEWEAGSKLTWDEAIALAVTEFETSSY